jgi:hypothetical protein
MAPGDCCVLPALYEYLGDHMFQSSDILDTTAKLWPSKMIMEFYQQGTEKLISGYAKRLNFLQRLC